ncbi:MAG: hypothetical protein F4W90_10250 [Gammaproteobacteria bacterium]|nr:hypothetical protein [Gammaproteobacteria bacterium]
MVVVICGALALLAFLLLMKVLWSKKKPTLSKNVLFATGAVFVGSLGILMASGRLHWLAAAGTAILPFVRQVGLFLLRPLSIVALQNFMRGGSFNQAFGGFSGPRASAAPESSETATDEISMRLNHTTGEMTGNVLRGTFANRTLDSLSEQEIVSLYNSVGNDSKRLLTAYIQRYHPNLGENATHSETNSDSQRDSANDSISPDRARKILGVTESATREEIIEAHRRLMHRNHPDRGGSEYIASEINLAKQVLLDLL